MSTTWKVKQVTRKDFTYNEILQALVQNENNLTDTAKALTALGRGKVSRQLVRYWVNSEDFEAEFSTPHFEARQLIDKARAQDTARKLRRDVKNLSEVALKQSDWQESIRKAVQEIIGIKPKSKVEFAEQDVHGTGLTVEVLVSDLQIGKLTSSYNTEVALRRLKEVGVKARQAIQQKIDLGYSIDRIIIAFLGDIIESDEKHADSARACDSSTSEQMSDAIRGIYEYILTPLAPLSEVITCIGIVGNHDWNGNGIKPFKAGKTMLSYPIYTALKMLCEVQYPHMYWEIPEGVFHVDNIYDERVLYEHGVGVAVNEQAMKKRKTDRGEQIQKHIFYFRMGDKHNVSTFNNAQYVVNGSFFGGGSTGAEYSEVCGYHSQAGQWIGFHCERDDARTTLFDSFVIQLGHIQ